MKEKKKAPIMTKQLRKTIAQEFKGKGAKTIEVVDAADYSRANMVIYGMNIVVLRYFPRLEDGLNPCRLRLLWTMYHDHNLRPDGRYVKTPEYIGHTSKYHPHGDIKETFECMAREWENNAPLLDVRGNTGSQAGSGAAQMRYLDSKLSEYAWKCFFEDFDEDVAEMRDNYIRSDKEPVFLPAKYPNFLLNNLTGIAWGFSDSFPTFNLIEAFELTRALLRNPDMTNVHLFPDSLRGYRVIDNGTIQKVCDDGYGVIPCEANVDYIEEDHSLYITGFPEKIKYDEVIDKIASLVKYKKLTGISNIADTSANEVPSVVIELKKGANPYQVIDELFAANVGLRSSVELRYYFAERTYMAEYGLKGAILEWIDRRIIQVQKQSVKKLGTLQKRRHELEGLIPILSDKEKFHRVVDIILSGKDDEAILEELSEQFNLSSYQVDRLVDKKLRESSRKRLEVLNNELGKLKEETLLIRESISSKEKVKETIDKQLAEGIKLFGRPRLCPIVKEGERERPELFYRIVITKKYVKKLSIGSKQVGLISSDDDIVGYYPEVSEYDIVLVVDDLGKVYRVPVKKLQSNDMSSKGTELAVAVGLKGNAVRSVLINKMMLERKDQVFIGIFTKNGIVKTSPISQYITNKTEIQGILLNTDDKVCWAHIYDASEEENKQQLVYTVNGFGISFHIDNISVQDRLTKGTQYLKLDEGDYVAGVVQVSLDNPIFVLTCKGYGKICGLADIFEASKRRQAMIRITSLHDGDEVFRIMPIPSSDSVITVHLQSGEKKEFVVGDLEKMTRLAKGKKMVPVRQGDSIYRIKIN